MLSGSHLQSGPMVTQDLIPPSFSSEAHLSSASSTSDLPDLLYPSDVTGSPPPIYTFTPSSTTGTSTPRIPLQPYVYGPFRVSHVLGTGGFAKAIGAQDLASRRFLCLKVFKKDHLDRKHVEQSLFDELDVYKRIASSRWRPATTFLMELEMSFQTKNHICFAMDLMTGDLHKYLRARPEYCRGHASRWSAQLALGINALHEMGIIHRDIKAENILIDVRENIKIIDFGLSYMDEGPLEPWGEYASDVLGTTYCMAPEMVCNSTAPRSMKYGPPVDWWAFGCVLFELESLHNKPLFNTEDDITQFVDWDPPNDCETYESFPAFEDLDGSVAPLVVGLLDPLPSSRYGFEQVMNHKYFMKEDGTSEFSDSCSRALQRAEKPKTLPDLADEQTHIADIWCPLSSWWSRHTSNVKWTKPRDGGDFFLMIPSSL